MHLGQFIGQGSSSDVHAFGNFQVVKIFQSRFSFSEVQTEVAGLRIANAHGVPTPSAGDIVQVDNKYGIVLERIDGQRLADYVRVRPWMLWSGARIYAELYAKIHRCQAPEMPPQRQLLLEEIENNRFLSQQETRSIIARLDQLQDKQALCLGDFSPSNILMSKNGPVVVDFESALCGNPTADIALQSIKVDCANATGPHFRSWIRTLTYKIFLKHYLELSDARHEEIIAWRLPVAAARLARGYTREQSALTRIIRTQLGGTPA